MSAAETPEPLAGAAAPALSPHGLRIEPVGTPTAQPSSGDEPWAEENFYRVVLNLEGGEWVEVATFPEEAQAEAQATELVRQLAEGAWPRVKSRYLRPESVHSVEVSERRRYTGSSARASWAGQA